MTKTFDRYNDRAFTGLADPKSKPMVNDEFIEKNIQFGHVHVDKMVSKVYRIIIGYSDQH